MDNDVKHPDCAGTEEALDKYVQQAVAPTVRKCCVSKLTFLLTCFGGQCLCPQTKAGSVFFQYFCILFEDQKKSKISVGPNLGIVSEGSNPK